MAWLKKLIDRTADSFGSLPFIVLYNIVTMAWVILGIFAPWFPDRYPSNFYTMLVSWLAINMSSLLLYVGKRQQARERAEEEHKLKTLDTLLVLAEADADKLPLVRQIAETQVAILQYLQDRDTKYTRLTEVLQQYVQGVK